MIVLDEHGSSWLVANGDPGWKALSYLQAKGYTEIVLPTTILINGARRNGNYWPSPEEVIQKYKDWKAGKIDDDTMLRQFTLLDCCDKIVGMEA